MCLPWVLQGLQGQFFSWHPPSPQQGISSAHRDQQSPAAPPCSSSASRGRPRIASPPKAALTPSSATRAIWLTLLQF